MPYPEKVAALRKVAQANEHFSKSEVVASPCHTPSLCLDSLMQGHQRLHGLRLLLQRFACSK